MQNETMMILAMIAVMIKAVLLLTGKRLKKQIKMKQVQGIKLNLLLKSLLLCVQKQRGLRSLYQHNDVAMKAEIEQYIAENTRLIASAEYQYAELLNHDPHWRSIRMDWALLKSNIFYIDTENIVISHSVLIEDLIFMMENIALKSQQQLENTLSEEEVRAIWRNIPQTLEALGKTRAIGSGVASQGICSRENKSRLVYLTDEITRNYRYVSNQLRQMPVEEMNGMPSQVAQSIDSFLEIVHDKLIIPEVPDVAADAFFSQATQTMDGVSQLFDTLSDIKERQITRTAA